jgi:esterase/lipase superfamily enzyme
MRACTRFSRRTPGDGFSSSSTATTHRFDEAVYRFAQITHDSRATAVPVLFTWPSRGKFLAYAYDRESATYSRNALEEVGDDVDETLRSSENLVPQAH